MQLFKVLTKGRKQCEVPKTHAEIRRKEFEKKGWKISDHDYLLVNKAGKTVLMEYNQYLNYVEKTKLHVEEEKEPEKDLEKQSDAENEVEIPEWTKAEGEVDRPIDEIDKLREEYKDKTGKEPSKRWGVNKLSKELNAHDDLGN